jgi:hypothetical protein
MKKLLVVVGFCLMSVGVQASEAELNNTIVRVINQMNAILPLLDEAEDEIEPNARIRLHIDSFEGADRAKHPGVRDDLKSMRNALIDYINKPEIEPKTVKPLVFDFVGK